MNFPVKEIRMSVPNYKELYNVFKNGILNEENKDRIVIICSKTRQSIKLVDKAAEKLTLSERQIYLAKVYTFIFHYRLIEFDKQALSQALDSLEISNQIQLEFANKACKHFKLTAEEARDICAVFEDINEPVGDNSPVGIKLGHDMIASIFTKRKLVENLNSLFSELEFYFPSLRSKFIINGRLVDYVSKTKYYTDYFSADHLTKKVKNKKDLIKYIQKQKDDSSLLNNKQAMTIIKTSSRNQVDLINIADKKAGIMITVNSILLTLLIPMFASSLFEVSRFVIPIAILTVTCGLTILLATLATRPTIFTDKITSEKIQTGQQSIFYFKNFSNLSKEDFTSQLRDLITRDNNFEQSVFTDLYDAGKDLDRTYKRLRWCYTIFGSGILITMISFLLCIAFTAV